MRPVLTPGTRRPSPDLLIGGQPQRALRLSPAGVAALDAVLAGRPHQGAAALTRRLAGAGLLLVPPGRSRTAEVTVVVPARAGAAEVATTLAGIPAGVPVVVVDDGSPHPLRPALAARAGLTVVRNERPTGAAAARNTGAALARTPLIAFVDTDVALPAGWLDALTGHLAGDVLAIAPRVVSRAGRGLADVLERDLCALDMGPAEAVVRPGSPVPYVPSTTLVLSRAAFEAAGGFDPALSIGEDVDLVWRLADRGTVRYLPAVVVRHGPRELGAALRRRFVYGTSVGPLDRRRPGALRHLVLSRWSALPWLVAVAHPAAGAAVAAGLVWLAPRGLPTLPPAEARRLAARGQWSGALGLGRYALRPGLPLTLAVLAASPRARRLVPALLAAYAASAAPVLARRPLRRVPARAALRLAEDAWYTAGAWTGCWRARTARPLLPELLD